MREEKVETSVKIRFKLNLNSEPYKKLEANAFKNKVKRIVKDINPKDSEKCHF